MVKISVIIPVYNVSAYLERCLNSCICQSFSDIEIIAVNDGSQDSSGGILDRFANIDSRLIVLHQENNGVVSARNSGKLIARGEYLFFLDADDFLPEDALERLYNSTKGETADIIYGDINCIDENENFLEIKEYAAYYCKTGEDLLVWILQNRTGYLWGKLIRCELFDSEKIYVPFHLVFCEDLIEIIQLSNNASKVVKAEGVVYNYVQRASSVCQTKVSFEELAKRYFEISISLKKLIQSMQFSELALSNLKRLFLFYATLFLWFNGGYTDKKQAFKPFVLDVLKNKETLQILKTESRKRYFLTFLTAYFPKLVSWGYKFFFKYRLKRI